MMDRLTWLETTQRETSTQKTHLDLKRRAQAKSCTEKKKKVRSQREFSFMKLSSWLTLHPVSSCSKSHL